MAKKQKLIKFSHKENGSTGGTQQNEDMQKNNPELLSEYSADVDDNTTQDKEPADIIDIDDNEYDLLSLEDMNHNHSTKTKLKKSLWKLHYYTCPRFCSRTLVQIVFFVILIGLSIGFLIFYILTAFSNRLTIDHHHQ